MNRIHLSPRLYTSLQDFVHKGHHRTFERLRNLLEIQPGNTVVEVGCGTGVLAGHFVSHGYSYWGIDLDPERIVAARGQNVGANFLAHNALDIEHAQLPALQYVYIHGLLHHIDDEGCKQLIDHLMLLRPKIVLAVIEPFSPEPWWKNAPGALFAKMDEGKFVRTLEGWKNLLSPYLESYTTRSLYPRWPVGFMDARLIVREQ